jgi:hypothetical protein
MKTCVLCRKRFSGYGNNPWPVSRKGQCCDDCDARMVIPARLRQLGFSEKDSKTVGEFVRRTHPRKP